MLDFTEWVDNDAWYAKKEAVKRICMCFSSVKYHNNHDGIGISKIYSPCFVSLSASLHYYITYIHRFYNFYAIQAF